MSNRLNKQDFAAILVEKDVFTTKKEAIEAVETIFDTVANILIAGDSLAISDFGKFSTYTRINGTKKPKFTPFSGFKADMNA